MCAWPLVHSLCSKREGGFAQQGQACNRGVHSACGKWQSSVVGHTCPPAKLLPLQQLLPSLGRAAWHAEQHMCSRFVACQLEPPGQQLIASQPSWQARLDDTEPVTGSRGTQNAPTGSESTPTCSQALLHLLQVLLQALLLNEQAIVLLLKLLDPAAYSMGQSTWEAFVCPPRPQIGMVFDTRGFMRAIRAEHWLCLRMAAVAGGIH